MSRLAGKAVVLSIARIANYGLMLLSPVLLVRILPVEQFGRYREFLVYTSLLIAIAGFNINDSLLYFIPAHARSRWLVVRQTTLLVACSSALTIAGVVALDLIFHGALIGPFLLPTALYVLAFVNIDFWEWYWLASHRPVPVFAYTTGRLIARMAVVIAAAALTHRIDVIIWSIVALEACRLVGSAIAWRASAATDEPRSAEGLWREQLHFCMPWGLAAVFGMASRNLGNIVVVRMLGAASLAYYTIGLYGEPIVIAIRNSISAVLLPEMVRRGGISANERLAIWRRATVVNCIMLLPISVLLARFAEPLVVFVFGAVYRPAALVLQIYTLVIVRECFDLTLPLRSASRTLPLVASTALGFSVNLVCLLVLVPKAGIAGAALALVAASASEALFLYGYVCRVERLSAAELVPWGHIAKVAAAAVLAGAVTLSESWTAILGVLGILCAGAAYLVAFAILLWLLGVPEAQLFWDGLRRVTGRRVPHLNL
jgi:O-antigen/teichoic acid export membrane protein